MLRLANMKPAAVFILFFCCFFFARAQKKSHDLQFDTLAARWDEGIPLGNAHIGALIWQRNGKIRFSLDRADLWDLRPMKGLHRKEFSYAWVQQQVKEKQYDIVQKYFDAPYDTEPAPSKIPGGALEFAMGDFGRVKQVRLDVQNAVCVVKWENGITLKTYVHATKPVGWFRFEGVKGPFLPELIPPVYEGETGKAGGPVEGDALPRLGYKQGAVKKETHSITYTQKGWGDFSYEINVRWKKAGTTIEGVWSITSQHQRNKPEPAASVLTPAFLREGFDKNYVSHKKWWDNFWSKSSISIPDTLLEKQWYLEQYKFGSAARKDAPPISLQAVWTADNGRIPPWKGDFHHDLNTQLSYWPAYSGNHLNEATGYLHHLNQNKANYKRYTKQYFGVDGLAVPGVTTLDGTEMGGWIQYALSPTASSWLAQHYYWQWRYGMDREFLKTSAYPWLKDVALFIEHITFINEQGKRQLPISSSPEINDNSLQAWFPQNTNYDLALMKSNLTMAAELAAELGLKNEAAHWKKIAAELPGWALSANNELMIAPDFAYKKSHRHFSHAMAIYPAGLIRWENGASDQKIIKNTLHLLDSIGPGEWCGYSYAWLGSLKARAMDGDGAAKALQIFAKAFCSPNSFHLNGDQTKSGYSGYTYRPFTLEGNFAFASGLQEMLLQSYAGYIHIMPAVPDGWKDVSFHQLRAQGAFLVDAEKKAGKISRVQIMAEKGGLAKLKLPFKKWRIVSKIKVIEKEGSDGVMEFDFEPNGKVIIENAG